MEEHARRTKKIARFGLLVFASVLLSHGIAAQTSRRAGTATNENMFFYADEDSFFVGQDAAFTLFVPNVEASDVRMALPAFPESVAFVSSRSETVSSSHSERGTRIKLELRFKTEGSVSVPPASLFIKGKKSVARFPEIHVLPNPQTIVPRAVFVFENGEIVSGENSSFPNFPLVQGSAARFTVCVQYAAAVGRVSWSLPKDAIFKEVKRFEIPSDLKQFSAKRIPVAQFEWTSLSDGIASVPKIRIAAETYSGQNVFLETPDCAVKVLPQKQGAQNNFRENAVANAERIFPRAFDVEGGESDAGYKTAAPDASGLSEIARVRSRERHSLFQNKIRSERAALERSFGIENAPNEKSVPFFFVLCSAAFLFAVFFAVLCFRRKNNFAFAAAALAVLFSLFALAFSQDTFKRHGIVVGGELYSVPEHSVVSKTAVLVASRVFVRREIDRWYLIEYNESCGWIEKENLILIN